MSFKHFISVVLIFSLLVGFNQKREILKIYLIGDSTMADYSDNYDPGKDYMATRYPVTGWGQVFQGYFSKSDLPKYSSLFRADSVVVDDRARGGRSTRTFFQEGRWRKVFNELNPGDLVLMQFGHNDAANNKTERYVDIEGYKEFLRLYVTQTRQKGGIPIILTPVARNYPWEKGQLKNVHGDYPNAAYQISLELNTLFIDLNKLSMEVFSTEGREYVTRNYFMNLEAGKYEAYPEGSNDNTHFLPEGANIVAQIVAEAMKKLNYK